MDTLTQKKAFPDNYPEDVMKVLRAMTIPNGEIALAGSASLRSMQYSADYDGVEYVDLKTKTKEGAGKVLATDFKNVIRKLQTIPNCFIGDIKCGEIEEWRIIPSSVQIVRNRLIGWNAKDIRAKIEELVKEKVLSTEEKGELLRHVKEGMSVPDFLVFKDLARPHIVRWTPGEVLRGKKKLIDGTDYKLEDAILTPSVCKIDAIAWVAGNHFSDFSIVYIFKWKGENINEVVKNFTQSLEEDILKYTNEGKWFKALKRHYSLAKARDDLATMKRILPILNGDLGRLYSLTSDIGTLLWLLENKKKLPLKEIKFELDQFKGRFGNIYETSGFLQKEGSLLAKLKKAIEGRPAVIHKQLLAIQEELDKILASSTPK